MALSASPVLSHDLTRQNLVNGADQRAVVATLADQDAGILFEIFDEVTDGCWPSPRAARDELIFQSRLRGWNTGPSLGEKYVHVVVSVSGQEIAPNYCVVSSSFEAKLPVSVLLDEATYTEQLFTFFSGRGMAWSNKPDAPKHIEEGLLENLQTMFSFIQNAQ